LFIITQSDKLTRCYIFNINKFSYRNYLVVNLKKIFDYTSTCVLFSIQKHNGKQIFDKCFIGLHQSYCTYGKLIKPVSCISLAFAKAIIYLYPRLLLFSAITSNRNSKKIVNVKAHQYPNENNALHTGKRKFFILVGLF